MGKKQLPRVPNKKEQAKQFRELKEKLSDPEKLKGMVNTLPVNTPSKPEIVKRYNEIIARIIILDKQNRLETPEHIKLAEELRILDETDARQRGIHKVRVW